MRVLEKEYAVMKEQSKSAFITEIKHMYPFAFHKHHPLNIPLRALMNEVKRMSLDVKYSDTTRSKFKSLFSGYISFHRLASRYSSRYSKKGHRKYLRSSHERVTDILHTSPFLVMKTMSEGPVSNINKKFTSKNFSELNRFRLVPKDIVFVSKVEVPFLEKYGFVKKMSEGYSLTYKGKQFLNRLESRVARYTKAKRRS